MEVRLHSIRLVEEDMAVVVVDTRHGLPRRSSLLMLRRLALRRRVWARMDSREVVRPVMVQKMR